MGKALTEEEVLYFARFEALFRNDGWFQLVEELRRERDEIPNVAFGGATSMEQLCSARAVHRTLGRIIDLPSEIGIRLQHALESAEQEAESDDFPIELDP